MEWLWIIVIVMALIGSLTWVLPSPSERLQGKRRSEALTLGLRVRIMTVENWVAERMGFERIAQYMLRCEVKPRPFSLWRIADREDSWVSPPKSESVNMLPRPLLQLLDALPEHVVGVGAEGQVVWLAWDDAKPGLEPESIRQILQQVIDVVGAANRT